MALTGSEPEEPRLPWRKLWRMLWRCSLNSPRLSLSEGSGLPAASAKPFSLLLLPVSRFDYVPPNNCNSMQGCVRRGHALSFFLFSFFLFSPQHQRRLLPP